MIRWIAAALVLTATANFADSPETVAAANPTDTILMEGIELQFHEDGPTFGEARPPSFRVSAARGEWAETSRQWTLEVATAVIHRAGEDDLHLTAARGFCDLEQETAVLSDGVSATTGDITVDVADLHYDNASGIARSDADTHVTDGVNQMNGKAIVIDTRSDRVDLREGSGRIRMAQAPSAPAGGTAQSGASDSRYESLDLDFEGVLRANLETGQIQEVTKDVVLTMIGIEPADNLTVTAQKITFVYLSAADKKPSKIHLTGGVDLKHGMGSGRSDEVTVDFATGDVEFRGNAELTGEMFDGARANVITINLYTKNAVLGPGGSIDRVKMNATPAEPAQAQN